MLDAFLLPGMGERFKGKRKEAEKDMVTNRAVRPGLMQNQIISRKLEWKAVHHLVMVDTHNN